MYSPPSFAETDLATLHKFIEQHSFGLLITCEDASDGNSDGASEANETANRTTRPQVSHLPLLIDRDQGTHGRLVGHMARANSQWRQADGRRVVVVFSGPHAYISPAWYGVDNAVPTWNYVAVHAAGTFRLTDSRAERLETVQRFVDFYEPPTAAAWSLQQADESFVDGLLDAIVAFTIEIDRLQGKWKLSQNHDRPRREQVIHALKASSGDLQRQVAELMQQTLDAEEC